jgi:hypothetical protein
VRSPPSIIVAAVIIVVDVSIHSEIIVRNVILSVKMRVAAVGEEKV